MECVVCNELNIGTNHKCDPHFLAWLEMQRQLAAEEEVNETRTFDDRLSEGFSMMGED